MRIRGRNRALHQLIPDQSPHNLQAREGELPRASKLSNGGELHPDGDLPTPADLPTPSQGLELKMKLDSGETMISGHSHRVNSNSNKHSESTSTKKRRNTPSAAVVIEGSRCSRVNGRGWRCCQPTLVGYSLCEHHLGKGRMRSMTSVRGQLGTSKPVVINHNASESSDQIGFQEEGKLATVPQKKRNKMGMVKARSISSLLDQTNHPPAETESQNTGQEPLQ